MKYRISAYAAVLGLAALAGCAGSPSQRFYTLSENNAALTASLPNQDYGVVEGPVSVPDIVDRPQFVLRMGGNEVKIVEQVRWAEPLKEGIARAVAANLAQTLNNARISPQTQRPAGPSDYQVTLDVQRFDSAPSAGTTLELVWTLRRARDGALQSGLVTVQQPVAGAAFQELVAAHMRALTEVSSRIADAIRSSRKDGVAAAGSP